MAIGGPFLSSFLQSYLLKQELARRQQGAETEDLLSAVKMKEFLRQRAEEQGGQQALADILAKQASRRMAPVSPVSVSTAQAPPEAPGAFGEAIPVEQPGGAMGLLIPAEAQRPPVLQSVLEGVEPAQAAKLLTNPAMRQGLKSVEDAEEERRKHEDKAQAEEFMKAAGVELKAGNYLGFSDNYAAAMRRIGRQDEAGRWTERGLLLRKETERKGKADAYMKRLADAASKWDDDDSPEHWDTLIGAITSAEPAEQAAVSNTIFGRWVTDRMKDNTVPPPVRKIDVEYMRLNKEDKAAGRDPDLVGNWGKVYEKFPQFATRHTVFWDTVKGGLPDALRRYLRRSDTEAEKELGGDASKAALGRMKLEHPTLVAGTPAWRLKYEDLRAAEITARESPLATAQRERIEEQTKILKGADTADVTKLDEKTLTLQAQRLTNMAENLEIDDPEASAAARRLAGKYVKELDRRRGGAPSGGKPAAPVQPGKPLTKEHQALKARRDALVQKNYHGRVWGQLTPEEKQAVADLIEPQVQ